MKNLGLGAFLCILLSLDSSPPLVEQVREQISLEWVNDLELVAAENYELQRHREDAMGLDEEDAERDRKMVFDHGESRGWKR